MRHFILAGTIALAAMAWAGAGAHGADQAQNSATTASETERLNREAAERARLQAEERARVEAQIRANEENNARIDQENARRQREFDEQMRARDAAIAAEQARYNAEMERFRAEQAARQSAQRGGRSGSEARANAAPQRTASNGNANASGQSCAQQVRRNRQRGRAVGGALGGIAGVVGGRQLGTAARIGVAVVSVPVGALIGDAIASRLNCREQEQAARATEQAVEGGVGTTISWRSETRPNVTGTSTVTAIEAPPVPATPAATPVAAADTTPCLTVTDIIIVEGEETRAPKRMCRRPPTNRFVRV
jgi:hypothetical protein